MIDFHAHILPGIDDGSRNAEESILMLRAEKTQGIKAVVATPHFYPEEQSITDFLANREEARKRLQGKGMEGLPGMLLGAEVLFYEGMTRSEHLPRLCIEGTRLLLLEMPWDRWPERTVTTLLSFRSVTGLSVVLAHGERYLPMQKRSVQKAIFESDVLIQCNAAFFSNRKTEREACRMLREGKIHFLGSDAHRMDTRPPEMAEAVQAIARRNGAEAPMRLSNLMDRILADARA